MAQWMKATDYHLMNTGVTFESASKDLKDLFDRCEYYCKKNLAVFTDKKYCGKVPIMTVSGLKHSPWAEKCMPSVIWKQL